MAEQSLRLSTVDDSCLVDGTCHLLAAPLVDFSMDPEAVLSFDCPVSSPILSGNSPPTSPRKQTLAVATAQLQATLPISSVQAPQPRDVEAELRDIVDDLLRKKKDAQQMLAEENAALRAQVDFLKHALSKASSQPGSETGDVLAALDRERSLRQNAEESRMATGKYLAEQVETVSKQKCALETELRNFTHGREFWRHKAIAALERCEALEKENLMVKTQLNTMARKQMNVVTQQVDVVLQEVAEERNRLLQLEDMDTPERKAESSVKMKTASSRSTVEVEKVRKMQASKRAQRLKVR